MLTVRRQTRDGAQPRLLPHHNLLALGVVDAGVVVEVDVGPTRPQAVAVVVDAL